MRTIQRAAALSHDVFNWTSAPVLESLVHHEKNPTHALLLFHLGAGLIGEAEDSFDDLSTPTDTDLSKCVREFGEEMSVTVKRVGCAGCGRICHEKDVKSLVIGEETNHLVRGEVFAASYRMLSDLGKLAHHVVEKQGVLYHVAPKLVTDGAGLFCSRCQIVDDTSAEVSPGRPFF